MLLRLLLSLFMACTLMACTSPQKKKDMATAQEKAKMLATADMEGDPDFLAFVSRLRKAVAQHDVDTLAPMMTQNFGYRLDPLGEGPGVFQYWDQLNLWPQILAVLNQHFVTKGNFVVAPPAFGTDENYHGYRAGITSVEGSWKFAYFVTD